MTSIDLDPKCWGPAMWFSMHSIAAGYPESNPSTETIQKYKLYFESLGGVLPCKVCRDHYADNLVKLPITGYLNSRRDLSFWVYSLHNLVNEATGGSQESNFEDVYNHYNDFIVESCNSGTCGVGGQSKCKMIIKNLSLSAPQKYVLSIIGVVSIGILILIIIFYFKLRKNK